LPTRQGGRSAAAYCSRSAFLVDWVSFGKRRPSRRRRSEGSSGRPSIIVIPVGELSWRNVFPLHRPSPYSLLCARLVAPLAKSGRQVTRAWPRHGVVDATVVSDARAMVRKVRPTRLGTARAPFRLELGAPSDPSPLSSERRVAQRPAGQLPARCS